MFLFSVEYFVENECSTHAERTSTASLVGWPSTHGNEGSAAGFSAPITKENFHVEGQVSNILTPTHWYIFRLLARNLVFAAFVMSVLQDDESSEEVE